MNEMLKNLEILAHIVYVDTIGRERYHSISTINIIHCHGRREKERATTPKRVTE